MKFSFGCIGIEVFDKVKMSNKVIRAKNVEPKGEVKVRDIKLKVSSI